MQAVVRIERADPDKPDLVVIDGNKTTTQDFVTQLREACPTGYGELVDAECSGFEVDGPAPMLIDRDEDFLILLNPYQFIWLDDVMAVTIRPLAPGDKVVVTIE